MRKLITLTILIISFSVPLFALDARQPITFPTDEKITQPFFFWNDIENIPNSSSLRFFLVINNTSGSTVFSKTLSASVHQSYFILDPQMEFPAGDYQYRIECRRAGKDAELPYFGAGRYPINGNFTIDDTAGQTTQYETFINRYVEHHYNTIDNGYNALFFTSSGIITGGLAYLFFTVFDYNIWTRIVAYIFTASSVTGIGAGSYYTWQYFSTSSQIDKKYAQLEDYRSRSFRFSFACAW
jgi:hypothetical protein